MSREVSGEKRLCYIKSFRQEKQRPREKLQIHFLDDDVEVPSSIIDKNTTNITAGIAVFGADIKSAGSAVRIYNIHGGARISSGIIAQLPIGSIPPAFDRPPCGHRTGVATSESNLGDTGKGGITVI